MAKVNYGIHKAVKIKPIGSINSYDIADCYGWLSSDALRLYYVSNDKVYVARRKKIKSAFDYPRQIQLGVNGEDVISIWLNEDETEIYFVVQNDIYYAQRGSISTGFSEAKLYTDFFDNMDFVSAFCLAQKGNLAIVYYNGIFDDNNKSKSVIKIFKIRKHK